MDLGAHSSWWHSAVVYEVYPMSFYDADGDGVGDLRGILAKVDYIAHLGVDAVWLTPIYPSPWADNGYDVADYLSVHPAFGTLDDLYALRDALRARGIRLVLDLVFNHTSDEHPWFQAARLDPRSPFRDFYYFHPGIRGEGGERRPPNNWGSFFGGSAWTWDEQAQAYYLHLFDRKQPDLNWDHPPVRQALADIARTWLVRGVGGFRLDVINFIGKPWGLPDGRPEPGSAYAYNLDLLDREKVERYVGELYRAVKAQNPEAVMIGETPGVTLAEALRWTRPEAPILDMVISFDHVSFDGEEGNKWRPLPLDVGRFKEIWTRWQKGLSGRGWWAPYLGNHDQPRPASRYVRDGAYRAAGAVALHVLLFTAYGTPFLYQGEELGLPNAGFSSLDDYRDVESRNAARFFREAGMAEGEILALLGRRSRDNARVPIPWTDGPAGGFTRGIPWISPHPRAEELHVARQLADPGSLLAATRALIGLRRAFPAAAYGPFVPLEDVGGEAPPEVFAYLRPAVLAERFASNGADVGPSSEEGERKPSFRTSLVARPGTLLVLVNLSPAAAEVFVPAWLAAHDPEPVFCSRPAGGSVSSSGVFEHGVLWGARLPRGSAARSPGFCGGEGSCEFFAAETCLGRAARLGRATLSLDPYEARVYVLGGA
ncbi:MAG: alpha-glucosidase [Brockia lithotrophica]|nr:alpha-glucosidase [Brockia lithotrophica]